MNAEPSPASRRVRLTAFLLGPFFRAGEAWARWTEPQPDTLCAFMGCRHPRWKHRRGVCAVPRIDYYERRYDKQGNDLPPRERPCGCTWLEPFEAPKRAVVDNPQS